jgi:TolB protein
VTIVNGQPQTVSTPFPLLDPATTYQLTLCVRDHEEDPPRTVCSKPSEFSTPPAGGRSGIAFARGSDIWFMNANGTNPVPVTVGATGSAFPSWSPDGTKIAFQTVRNGRNEIWRMDADGSNQINLTTDVGGQYNVPAWSPDGTKIAFLAFHPGTTGTGIWVMDTDGSNKTLLAEDDSTEAQASWSPDGSRIAYTADAPRPNDPGTTKQIFVMNADGSNKTDISDLSGADYESAWSPDGTRILFKHNGVLWSMNPDGSHRTQLTNAISNGDDRGTWSPDGSKIAFVSSRGGLGNQIWRMDSSGLNPINLTATGSNDTPAWSPRP